MIFSAPSYAEWVKVTSSSESELYVDFSRIRKKGGYVYFWQLVDLVQPNKFGDFSITSYSQGDCSVFKWKLLTATYYPRPMAGGTGKEQKALNKDWHYPGPQTLYEASLDAVCEFAENYL